VKTMSESCLVWLSYTTQIPTVTNIQWFQIRITKTSIHTGLTVSQKKCSCINISSDEAMLVSTITQDVTTYLVLCVSLSQKHESYFCTSKPSFLGGKFSQFKEVYINWNNKTLYTNMAINGSMVHP